MDKVVMLDSSFMRRFMDETSELNDNATQYYRYFLENDFELCISTIALAENLTYSSIEEFPFKDVKIVPFNIDHAKKTGEFAQYLFQEKHSNNLKITSRDIIPNDTKLFSQAEVIQDLQFFISSDKESEKIYNKLAAKFGLKYKFIDLSISCSDYFGTLNFKDQK